MTTSRKRTTLSEKATTVEPKSVPTEGTAPRTVEGVIPSENVTERAPEMKKNDLIDRIIAKNGMKRKDVKPLVETLLSVLGEAIGKGETLNLQPMGKLVIKKTKDMPNATVTVCRIRRSKSL
ncbi:HU family DNA-binding protein [Falsihalocynthiibacter sp. S25ZX9]|uniref:HU family DNA-binding protein n=1 Tax=Falsihalocynthiibacter sp. S25ZX9 TaxID=3240870 RepID=UPI00350EE197